MFGNARRACGSDENRVVMDREGGTMPLDIRHYDLSRGNVSRAVGEAGR